MIYKWELEFKRGHTSIEGDPRSGRSKTATTPDIIKNIFIHRVGRPETDNAKIIGISHERVYTISVLQSETLLDRGVDTVQHS